MSENHSNHVGKLWGVYLALMVLLVLTVGVSRFDLGAMNIIVAMAIAVVKAVLVVLIFMHVAQSGKLVWIFASASFVFLGILFVITFSDYLSRNDLSKTVPFDDRAPFAHTIADHKPAQPKG